MKENNRRNSDFHNIEIKTKNYKSSSPISLFCCSIDSLEKSSSKIRENFGVEDEKSFNKIFNSTIKYGDWNTHRDGFSFKLEKGKEKNLYLRIISTIKNYPIDNDKYYWKYEKICELTSKIKNCLYVEGEINKDEKIVRYERAILYKNASEKKFWDLLERKDITVDFRIGIYKSGKKEGKTHDHGTTFRIKKESLHKLYDKNIKIE